MSKFKIARENWASIHWQLLATVSMAGLLGSGYMTGTAAAADSDADSPRIWIELGGQLSRLDDAEETFAPKLMDATPSIFTPPQKFERPPLFGLDETGKITFQPDDSNWSFSGSIRYGRSASEKNVHQQTQRKPFIKYYYTYASSTPHKHVSFSGFPSASKFADTQVRNSEHHLVLDFQAGKDVGLGMFGIEGGSSTLNLGVRFAQFQKSLNVSLRSDPDAHFNYKYYGSKKLLAGGGYHLNAASINAERSFHGVGPSLSWNASMPLAGNPQNSELTLDWGINAALLFGRQRARVHHQTTGRYHGDKYHQASSLVTYDPAPVNSTRSKSGVVPNLGGMLGLSMKYPNAKVSLGYRADMFFNAIDGGIDARKEENHGFFGPFASVSVGVGD